MMKHFLPLATVAALVAPCFTPTAVANDFQIAVLRKKAGALRAKPGQSGDRLKASETVFYQVTVNNRSFGQPTKELEARYILAVERQELGSKKGEEHIERVRGTAKVESMKPHGKVEFSTDEVTLREQALAGNYVYRDGGRVKATDNLVGVWIRLYDGETQVAEYLNPTTLANKIQWD